MAGEHKIVVGVDGSAPSRAALRWAARQAELIGGEIEAIITWELPVSYGLTPVITEGEDLEGAARQALAAAVADVLGPRPSTPVRQRVVQGNAARVLLEAARDAELLVVGSRGHGGFAGALLGSVSQHCASHASCPVVIIRDQVG